jgi:hypothetical protein
VREAAYEFGCCVGESVGRVGSGVEVLEPGYERAEYHLADDGCFEYFGGFVPVLLGEGGDASFLVVVGFIGVVL